MEDFRPVHLHNSFLASYSVKFYLSPKLSTTAHVRHLVFKNGRLKTPKPRYNSTSNAPINFVFESTPTFSMFSITKKMSIWRSKMADIKFQYGRRYIIKFFLDAYVIRIYYFIIRQYYEHNNVYIVYVT